MSEYKPVACALHSEYELAIMHKKKIRLIWMDNKQVQQLAQVLPVVIFTLRGKEFLSVVVDGEAQNIRLDKIISASF